MFDSFIFDVEGTLLDSVSQNQRSLQDALENPDTAFRSRRSTSTLASTAIRRCNSWSLIPERERVSILEDRRQIYERDYLPSVRPLEGARDAIRTLAKRGRRVVLATDCKGASFKRYMALLDADDYITATACGDDLEHGKPDPRLVGVPCASLVSPPPRRSWSAIRHTTPRLASRLGQRLPAF
jgi:beta-phosphoglucomutase-like phosphatase (HAD superfamily)